MRSKSAPKPCRVLFAALGALMLTANLGGCGPGESSERAPKPVHADPDRSTSSFPLVEDRSDVLWPLADLTRGLAEATLRNSGIEIQVLTLQAPDADMEELANRLFEARQVGDRGKTGGILILVETAERRARIEVSYELEGAFPDAITARIARNQLVPYASYRAMSVAVMDVVNLLGHLAFDRAHEGALELAPEFREREAFLNHVAEYRSGGGGSSVLVPDLPIDHDFKRRIPETQRARYAPGRTPEASVEAWNRMARDAAWDPTLPIHTPASQVFRAGIPVALYEERRWLRLFEAAAPYRTYQEGDRAVVRTAREGGPETYLPLLLRRIDGLWRVDSVETFKGLFTAPPGGYSRVRSWRMPYRFGFPGVTVYSYRYPAPIDTAGRHPSEVIAELEGAQTAREKFQLAELLYRNAYLWPEAHLLYREAARLAPEDAEISITLGERLIYDQAPAEAIEWLEPHGPASHALLGEAHYRLGNVEEAKRFLRSAIDNGVEVRLARYWLRWIEERRAG